MVWETLESEGAERCLLWSERSSGLRAVLVIDDLTLGPAAGGIRTRAYPSVEDAVRDAARLARAMTIKCALAGLAAGGGKAVVLDHPGLDRRAAFDLLGRRIEELGGLFRTAGDLGTRAADLETMARHTRYVHTDETGLCEAVARGLLRCVEACARVHGAAGAAGLRIAIQGTGAIGAAAARVLAAAGVRLVVADVDADLARAVAEETGADVVSPEHVLSADVDIVAPCAVGGVVDEAVARSLRAWAVCGAANNVLSDARAAEALRRRGVLHVPDVIASAGAVIHGIGRSVMGLADPEPLIDALGTTALGVLERARAERSTESEVANRMARKAIETGGLRTCIGDTPQCNSPR